MVCHNETVATNYALFDNRNLRFKRLSYLAEENKIKLTKQRKFVCTAIKFERNRRRNRQKTFTKIQFNRVPLNDGKTKRTEEQKTKQKKKRQQQK